MVVEDHPHPTGVEEEEEAAVVVVEAAIVEDITPDLVHGHVPILQVSNHIKYQSKFIL